MSGGKKLPKIAKIQMSSLNPRTLLISPHNDDESLFCAYTIMREKPLVLIITDAYIQHNRGEKGCDAITRWNESVKAMDILGAPLMRVGIKDYELDYHFLCNFFKASFGNFDKIYIPALQGGNPHHDIVSRACYAVFGHKVQAYSTYAPGQFFTKGNIEIVPTEEEFELKKKALECYTSQINLPATKGHFEAVLADKKEYLM